MVSNSPPKVGYSGAFRFAEEAIEMDGLDAPARPSVYRKLTTHYG